MLSYLPKTHIQCMAAQLLEPRFSNHLIFYLKMPNGWNFSISLLSLSLFLFLDQIMIANLKNSLSSSKSKSTVITLNPKFSTVELHNVGWITDILVATIIIVATAIIKVVIDLDFKILQ